MNSLWNLEIVIWLWILFSSDQPTKVLHTNTVHHVAIQQKATVPVGIGSRYCRVAWTAYRITERRFSSMEQWEGALSSSGKMFFVDQMHDWLIDWLIQWIIVWLIDWLIDWLIQWIIVWLIDRLIDWLINYFQSGAASFEECRLQLLIHAYKLLPTTSLELTEAQVIPVMRIMRLYIHLKESAELTLTTEEHRTLSKLATCRTTGLSTLSNQFIVLGLCCFTLLPDLLVDRTVETDFVEWVKWMLEVDVAALDAMVPDGGTHLEVLLLITSHLRAGQYKNITEILSDCLGFKVRWFSRKNVWSIDWLIDWMIEWIHFFFLIVGPSYCRCPWKPTRQSEWRISSTTRFSVTMYGFHLYWNICVSSL